MALLCINNCHHFPQPFLFQERILNILIFSSQIQELVKSESQLCLGRRKSSLIYKCTFKIFFKYGVVEENYFDNL
jgi:hypothetical protein